MSCYVYNKFAGLIYPRINWYRFTIGLFLFRRETISIDKTFDFNLNWENGYFRSTFVREIAVASYPLMK